MTARQARRRDRATTARTLAFDILTRVEERGAYASILLDHWLPRLPDDREAALAHELVLGVLRQRSRLDTAIGAVASRPLARIEPAVLRSLRLGTYGLLFLDRVPEFAAVDTAVELVKRARRPKAAGFVNACLRAVARAGQPPEPAAYDPASLSRRYSHPEWWVRRVLDRIGRDPTIRLLEADNRAAPTVLRANLARTTPDALRERLQGEGVRTEPCRYVSEALRVVRGVPQRAAAFRSGECWVQDEASQLVPALFADPLGPRVADLCAAPGTKSLCLAERLVPGGLVLGIDHHPGRLRRMAEGLRRLGRSEVLPLAADMSAERPPIRGEFDQVLVDAPCSGTGTLRRHPEIRWRLEAAQLSSLAARQRTLLDNGAALVRRGGELAYAVCSLEPEEGDEILAGFLETHPGFRLADPRPRLPPRAGELIGSDLVLRTDPSRDGLDGFFAAVLVRDA